MVVVCLCTSWMDGLVLFTLVKEKKEKIFFLCPLVRYINIVEMMTNFEDISNELILCGVIQSFIPQYYTRKEMQCLDSSSRLCRLIITYNKHIEPFFTQLKNLCSSFKVYQWKKILDISYYILLLVDQQCGDLFRELALYITSP